MKKYSGIFLSGLFIPWTIVSVCLNQILDVCWHCRPNVYWQLPKRKIIPLKLLRRPSWLLGHLDIPLKTILAPSPLFFLSSNNLKPHLTIYVIANINCHMGVILKHKPFFKLSWHNASRCSKIALLTDFVPIANNGLISCWMIHNQVDQGRL